jgi:hypothetical protein
MAIGESYEGAHITAAIQPQLSLISHRQVKDGLVGMHAPLTLLLKPTILKRQKIRSSL